MKMVYEEAGAPRTSCALCEREIETRARFAGEENGTRAQVCIGCGRLDAPLLAELAQLATQDGDCYIADGLTAAGLVEELRQADHIDGLDVDAALRDLERELWRRGRVDVMFGANLWVPRPDRAEMVAERLATPGLAVVDQPDPDQVSLETYTRAAIADGVVSAVTGGTLDRTAYLAGEDPGYVILPDGRRAMVRYRSRLGWPLAFHENTPRVIRAPILMLVWPDVEQAETLYVMGWISSEEFAAVAHHQEYLPGRQRWFVHASQLHASRDFLVDSNAR
jgi:hypothetical protein